MLLIKDLIFKYLCLLSICLVVNSCRNSNIEDYPVLNTNKDSIIQRDLFIEFASEIFLIEARIYKLQTEGEEVYQNTIKYYNGFFQKHEISKDLLFKSVEYYTAKEMLEDILQDVIVNLTQIELKYSNIEEQIDTISPKHGKVGFLSRIIEYTE